MTILEVSRPGPFALAAAEEPGTVVTQLFDGRPGAENACKPV
jgi:hypothetical protein